MNKKFTTHKIYIKVSIKIPKNSKTTCVSQPIMYQHNYLQKNPNNKLTTFIWNLHTISFPCHKHVFDFIYPHYNVHLPAHILFLRFLEIFPLLLEKQTFLLLYTHMYVCHFKKFSVKMRQRQSTSDVTFNKYFNKTADKYVVYDSERSRFFY